MSEILTASEIERRWREDVPRSEHYQAVQKAIDRLLEPYIVATIAAFRKHQEEQK